MVSGKSVKKLAYINFISYFCIVKLKQQNNMAKKFKRQLIYNGICRYYNIHDHAILKVWQNKLSMFAKVYDSKGKECIMSAHFYEKDGDMSLYRVKEYFGLV